MKRRREVKICGQAVCCTTIGNDIAVVYLNSGDTSKFKSLRVFDKDGNDKYTYDFDFDITTFYGIPLSDQESRNYDGWSAPNGIPYVFSDGLYLYLIRYFNGVNYLTQLNNGEVMWEITFDIGGNKVVQNLNQRDSFISNEEYVAIGYYDYGYNGGNNYYYYIIFELSSGKYVKTLGGINYTSDCLNPLNWSNDLHEVQYRCLILNKDFTCYKLFHGNNLVVIEKCNAITEEIYWSYTYSGYNGSYYFMGGNSNCVYAQLLLEYRLDGYVLKVNSSGEKVFEIYCDYLADPISIAWVDNNENAIASCSNFSVIINGTTGSYTRAQIYSDVRFENNHVIGFDSENNFYSVTVNSVSVYFEGYTFSKYDGTTGNQIWSKTISLPLFSYRASSYQYGYSKWESSKIDSENNFYYISNYNSDISQKAITKLSGLNGDILWQKTTQNKLIKA
jgi:hypothetical protein